MMNYPDKVVVMLRSGRVVRIRSLLSPYGETLTQFIRKAIDMEIENRVNEGLAQASRPTERSERREPSTPSPSPSPTDISDALSKGMSLRRQMPPRE